MQLCVDEDTQEVLTINSYLGLFELKLLFFGVPSSPAISQSLIKHYFIIEALTSLTHVSKFQRYFQKC